MYVWSRDESSPRGERGSNSTNKIRAQQKEGLPSVSWPWRVQPTSRCSRPSTQSVLAKEYIVLPSDDQLRAGKQKSSKSTIRGQRTGASFLLKVEPSQGELQIFQVRLHSTYMHAYRSQSAVVEVPCGYKWHCTRDGMAASTCLGTLIVKPKITGMCASRSIDSPGCSFCFVSALRPSSPAALLWRGSIYYVHILLCRLLYTVTQ